MQAAGLPGQAAAGRWRQEEEGRHATMPVGLLSQAAGPALCHGGPWEDGGSGDYLPGQLPACRHFGAWPALKAVPAQTGGWWVGCKLSCAGQAVYQAEQALHGSGGRKKPNLPYPSDYLPIGMTRRTEWKDMLWRMALPSHDNLLLPGRNRKACQEAVLFPTS